MLFLSHLGLVLSIIFGLSVARFHSEWNSKIEHLAALSASHLSPYVTFLSGSVAGRNYANLLMASTSDNLKAIPNLKFVQVSGHSDYQNQPVSVRYSLNDNKVWRMDVMPNEIVQLSDKLKQLKAELDNTANDQHIHRKKISYLINKVELELRALTESVSLQSLAIPNRPEFWGDNYYTLDEKQDLLHIVIELRNVNKGEVWAVIDAKPLDSIQTALLNDVVKEAALALLISSLLIYLVTNWLVRPLKRLAASMKGDIEKIDKSMIPEIQRVDEIGDLARSYSSLITRIKNQLKVLHNQTETDPLTGLGSRYKYKKYALPLMKERLQAGECVYFVLCDIDYFKRFNDTYGHTEGDNVLTAVANAMNDNLFPHELGCRLGGEEFIFIMSDKDESALNKRIQALHQSVTDLNIHHVSNPPHNVVTISAGAVPVHVVHSAEDEELNEHALGVLFLMVDQRLYKAKGEGRNLILFDKSTAQEEYLQLQKVKSNQA